MIRLQFEYDKDYNPPAPVVEVNLRTPNNFLEKLPALLDSGADRTTIPTVMINQLGARRVEKRRLITITGERITVGIYPINIKIGQETIYGIRAAGFGSEIILGRDVMNQLTIIMNGPIHLTEIELPLPTG